MKHKVLLAAHSMYPGNGGIARVARLMGRMLEEMSVHEGLPYRVQLLRDSDNNPPSAAATQVQVGSKLRFVLAVQRAVLSCSHFMYDSLGMARAHPLKLFGGPPMLTWMHGIEMWEDAPSRRITTARTANLLVANTEYTLSRARQIHGDFGEARVCWLATESDLVPNEPRQAEGPPTVLCVGRMDRGRYKGHSALIRSWPRVVSAMSDARLVFVGTGPAREYLTHEVAESPAWRSIQMVGFIPDHSIESLWSKATVFAMPSRGEGFGLVYIEAMRHAVPVIASVHDAGSEINVDGVTGYNIDLGKPGELADRIVELLRNPDLALGMGREGQNRWEAHFRYSSFRSRFRPILLDFLSM